jgi:uncharacterized protein
MLGSLATKLRILGYDTAYDRESSDEDLLRTAKQAKRIVVTSDYEMCMRAKRSKLPSILIQRENEQGRLEQLLSGLGIKKLDLGRKPRCSRCNGILKEETGKDSFGRPISRCKECGKIYWRGSHWKNLEALFEKVNGDLQ